MCTLEFSRCWWFCSRLRSPWDRTGSTWEAVGTWLADATALLTPFIPTRTQNQGGFCFHGLHGWCLCRIENCFYFFGMQQPNHLAVLSCPFRNGPHPVHGAGNGLGGVTSHSAAPKYLLRFEFVLLYLASAFTSRSQNPR